MRVLISGAAGFVGVHLVARFVRGGARVTALDLATADALARAFVADAGGGEAGGGERGGGGRGGGGGKRGGGSVRWIVGDVTDRAAMDDLVAAVRPDAIVHAAAVTFGADRERREPARVFDVNAGGTLALLEAARRHAVGTFTFVSSTGVYGPRPPAPRLDAASSVAPEGLYAVAKLAAEGLCASYARLGGPRARIGRLGSAYGALERPSAVRSGVSAVARAVDAALVSRSWGADAAARPWRVAGAEIARDFVHAADAADAFWWLTVADDLPATPFLVGPADAEPLACALDALAEAEPAFRWEPAAPEAADLVQTLRQARAGVDAAALERATPWRRRFDLRQGAVDVLRWERARTAT